MNPNTNILANVNKFVKEELAKDAIPADAKYVIVGTVDNTGAQILTAVNIHKGEKINTNVAAIWNHNWSGDDIIAAKVIFVGK